MSTHSTADLADFVTRSDEVMGGTPVFRSTRVPVQLVFDNLADGLSLEEILEEYPTLDRDDVVAFLRRAPLAIEFPQAA